MTVASLFLLSISLPFLFSLFSVIFGLIGVLKTLFWPSCSEIGVNFIRHDFKNSAIYKIIRNNGLVTQRQAKTNGNQRLL